LPSDIDKIITFTYYSGTVTVTVPFQSGFTVGAEYEFVRPEGYPPIGFTGETSLDDDVQINGQAYATIYASSSKHRNIYLQGFYDDASDQWLLHGDIDKNADMIQSGILPVARGGTNSTATPTAGGAAYGTGTANAYTAAGTSGQILRSNGASAPTWQGGTWTSFTSSITASAGSPTLGTSPTNLGYYTQTGKTVTGFIRAICGTSPTSATAGATYYFSLPVAARQVVANTPCGTFHIINGSTYLTGLIIGIATDKFFFLPQNAAAVTTTQIGALASGTQFNVFFTYEAS
jgi:hypothetical protein